MRRIRLLWAALFAAMAVGAGRRDTRRPRRHLVPGARPSRSTFGGAPALRFGRGWVRLSPARRESGGGSRQMSAPGCRAHPVHPRRGCSEVAAAADGRPGKEPFPSGTSGK